MKQAYESLWDVITKQFLEHTDLAVLTSAIQAINQLALNSSLSTSNTTKLVELSESIFSSLRDAVDGRDVAAMTIDDHEVAKFEAILLRLSLLAKSRDITVEMEDEEGGQSQGWEIVCAAASRGDLPYKEEAKVSPLSPLRSRLSAYLDRWSNTLCRSSSSTSLGCSRTSPQMTQRTRCACPPWWKNEIGR